MAAHSAIAQLSHLRSIEAIGIIEQFSGVNEQVWRLFFLDRPVGGTFRHISGVNCPLRDNVRVRPW